MLSQSNEPQPHNHLTWTSYLECLYSDLFNVSTCEFVELLNCYVIYSEVMHDSMLASPFFFFFFISVSQILNLKPSCKLNCDCWLTPNAYISREIHSFTEYEIGSQWKKTHTNLVPIKTYHRNAMSWRIRFWMEHETIRGNNKLNKLHLVIAMASVVIQSVQWIAYESSVNYMHLTFVWLIYTIVSLIRQSQSEIKEHHENAIIYAQIADLTISQTPMRLTTEKGRRNGNHQRNVWMTMKWYDSNVSAYWSYNEFKWVLREAAEHKMKKKKKGIYLYESNNFKGNASNWTRFMSIP